MEFITFAIFLIVADFVAPETNVPGTVKGVLDLYPALLATAKADKNLAESKLTLGEAVNATKNCGTSGSSEDVLKNAKANKIAAQATFAISYIIANKTSEDGQLELLNGDLSELTNAYYRVADTYNSLADTARNLAANIDTASFKDLDKKAAALEEVAKSLEQFYTVLSKLKNPSKLLIQLSTFLSGNNDGFQDIYRDFTAEAYAFSGLNERCGISNGVPEALLKIVKVGKEIYRFLTTA